MDASEVQQCPPQPSPFIQKGLLHISYQWDAVLGLCCDVSLTLGCCTHPHLTTAFAIVGVSLVARPNCQGIKCMQPNFSEADPNLHKEFFLLRLFLPREGYYGPSCLSFQNSKIEAPYHGSFIRRLSLWKTMWVRRDPQGGAYLM